MSPVTDAIQNLLATKSDVVVQAYRQKGGWEGWAQVEIANTLRGHGQVEREKLVYGPGNAQRADVVLTLPGGQVEILELKCWGQLRDQTEFVNKVRLDIDKIILTDGHVDTRAWAMVMVLQQPGQTVKNTIKQAMEGKRRLDAPGGNYVDKVEEIQVTDLGTGQIIYLLSFIMPVNVG